MSNPKTHWKVLSSEHFDLIYDAKQQDLALFYLVRLESAWSKLATLWSIRPERIPIAIVDRTDLTNGYATPLPYAHSVFFPVLPGPLESISEMGDWAENIAIHELTHILSFEQRRGTVSFLSKIFGNIMTPNLLLPRWWLEGVAVDAETRLSNQGRLRSNYQDAILRALAKSSRWQKIKYPEINESSLPTWPYGARPYLFGSLIWSEMIALEGEKMIQELHTVYGGRFPFFLSGPIDERFKEKSLADLFYQTKNDLQTRIDAQEKALTKAPLTNGSPFKDENFIEMFSSQISPNGLYLALLAKNDSLKRSIQIYKRSDTNEEFLAKHRIENFSSDQDPETPLPDLKIPKPNDAPPGGTINRLSWMPDSNQIVFDLVKEVDWFHDASDLWIYSVKKAKAEQLTFDQRAREPAPSPRGEKIAFIQISAGKTDLAIFDLKSRQVQQLSNTQFMQRLAWPTWISDHEIVVSLRDKKSEKLVLYDISNQQSKVLNIIEGEETLPFYKNGRFFFIGNQNGIRNIYETSLDFKNPMALTHIWTGAYGCDWDESRRELWITQISDNGFELTRVSQNKLNNSQPQNLPKVQNLLSDRYPVKNLDSTQQDTPKYEENEYSTFSYLLPHYWLPFFYFDDKGVQASISTGSTDPIGIHAYNLFASYDSNTRHGNYQLNYLNQSFRSTLGFLANHLSSTLADINEQSMTETLSAYALTQLNGISTDLSLLTGVEGQRNQKFRSDTKKVGPTIGLSYVDIQQSGEQISPEAGGSISLNNTYFTGGEELSSYNLAQLEISKYGKFPWLHHHAWFFSAKGQYADRNIQIADYEASHSTAGSAPPGLFAATPRGYVSGAFLSKSFAQGTLEYRFPISRLDFGFNKFALFNKRLSAAVVTDWIGLEGYQYNTKLDTPIYQRVSDWKVFGSGGLELNWDITLGYHFEMKVILGAYMPFNNDFVKSEPTWGLGLGI